MNRITQVTYALCTLSLFQMFAFSQHTAAQRGGPDPRRAAQRRSILQTQQRRITTTSAAQYPQTITRGSGRPSGQAQAWAERDIVPHLDRAGARTNQQLPRQGRE